MCIFVFCLLTSRVILKAAIKLLHTLELKWEGKEEVGKTWTKCLDFCVKKTVLVAGGTVLQKGRWSVKRHGMKES